MFGGIARASSVPDEMARYFRATPHEILAISRNDYGFTLRYWFTYHDYREH